MNQTRTIALVTQELNNIVYSDSHVLLRVHDVERALQADHAENGGLLPTTAECALLVCGGDADGEVPAGLQERFKHTHACLATHWE